MTLDDPTLNTDTELYREELKDYYANSIFVTEDGRIGMDVGGLVIVKPIAEWHKLAESSLSKDEILKARPAMPPQHVGRDNNDYHERRGYTNALKDWSKAMGIGETE